MPAALGLTRSSSDGPLCVRRILRALPSMGCSSSLRGIREQGCAAWKQSPKRDHAHACHQWTYRSIPWATLSDGLWQAPVRLRPGFPDAPPYSVAGGDRVSGLIGRTGRVPRYLLTQPIDHLSLFVVVLLPILTSQTTPANCPASASAAN